MQVGLDLPDSCLLCSRSDLLALSSPSSVKVFSFHCSLVGGLTKTCEVSPPGPVDSMSLWDGGLAIGTSTELALVQSEGWAVSTRVPFPGGARALSGAKTGSGSYVLVGGGRGALAIFSTALGAFTQTLPDHKSGVWACDLSADCSRTVSGTDRDELFVKVYDVVSKQLVREYDRPLYGDGIVRTLFDSPGNQTVFVADCEGSAVGIFDLRQASDDPAVRMPFPSDLGMTWHADISGHSVVAGRGPDVIVFDSRSPNSPRSTITASGSGVVTNVAFSQDLSCIFVSSRNKDDDNKPGQTTAYSGPMDDRQL